MDAVDMKAEFNLVLFTLFLATVPPAVPSVETFNIESMRSTDRPPVPMHFDSCLDSDDGLQ